MKKARSDVPVTFESKSGDTELTLRVSDGKDKS